MKLTDDVVNFIQRAVKTAKLVGIEKIIIETDCVRAMDSDKTVVINETNNIPQLPFDSIGIGVIDLFLSRLEIAKTQKNFSVDAKLDDQDNTVLALAMKATGTNIGFKCANPASIQAPKRVMDEMVRRVALPDEAVLLMQRGQSAMGADDITIISNDDGVSFEFVDVNNDIFKHTFADTAQPIGNSGADTRFAYRYPIKTLLSLFKQGADGNFEVGQKGILSISVNGFKVYVLPRV